MTRFASVQGWSPMMREVIRTRRMPPWHADPAYSHFANDVSLPPEEAPIAAVLSGMTVHWAE